MKRPFGCAKDNEQFATVCHPSFGEPKKNGLVFTLLQICSREITILPTQSIPRNIDRRLKQFHSIKGGQHASQDLNQTKIQQEKEA
jgi:hypothetical protein